MPPSAPPNLTAALSDASWPPGQRCEFNKHAAWNLCGKPAQPEVSMTTNAKYSAIIVLYIVRMVWMRLSHNLGQGRGRVHVYVSGVKCLCARDAAVQHLQNCNYFYIVNIIFSEARVGQNERGNHQIVFIFRICPIFTFYV